jgi:hypothetical protein
MEKMSVQMPPFPPVNLVTSCSLANAFFALSDLTTHRLQLTPNALLALVEKPHTPKGRALLQALQHALLVQLVLQEAPSAILFQLPLKK